MKVLQKKKPLNKVAKVDKNKTKKTKAQTNPINSNKIFLGITVL